MRASSILIISFALFVLAFLGYSLWESNSRQPFADVSKEQKEADMRMAEKYLYNAEPERSLPIIHKYKDEMERQTSDGKKWLNLFAEASAELNDADQLLIIYQFHPETLKINEKAALKLAELQLKYGNQEEYRELRKLWENREETPATWTLLDADALLQMGKKQQAYELLNDKHWLGKAEDERQMRLALIQLNDNPLEALEILNIEHSKDPRNPDIRLFRGKIYESQNKIALAEQDFNAAANLDPSNIYLQDQLAEFYRRQKNYGKALSIWQKTLNHNPNDQVWLKSLYWNYVTVPSTFNWKTLPLTEEKSKAFLTYLLSLKPGEYWDSTAFEKIPYQLDILSDFQTSYWLRLLQALKKQDEKEALSLLENNHFESSSWAPVLEISLMRILNYRQKGSLRLPADLPNSKSLLSDLVNQEGLPTLYKTLDQLAQQEADEGSLKLPEGLQSLLNSPQIFAVALLSEGWTEAALQITPPGLSADFPNWVALLYVNGLRQNRGNQATLQFLNQQKPTPIATLLKAEIFIANGQSDQAIAQLEKITQDASEVGTKAVWLTCLIDLEKGRYRKAGEALESHPQLSQTLQGQETLARIALMEGDDQLATQIYKKIVRQSKEAKSYLARQAYQQKNWKLAEQLTEALLNEFPGNPQLQENLKKIKEQQTQD